jgi:hypothetical protein
LIQHLKADFSESPIQVRRQEIGGGSKLGIHAIAQSGLSALYVVKPGVRTEVMLFFPNTTSIKDFKEGFRFFGVLGAENTFRE